MDENTEAIDESALLDQDPFSPYHSSLDDDPKVLDNVTENLSVVSNSVIMPPKKRTFIKIDDVPVEKKVALNRTTAATIEFDIPQNKPKHVPVIISANDKNGSEEKTALPTKSLSEAEVFALLSLLQHMKVDRKMSLFLILFICLKFIVIVYLFML